MKINLARMTALALVAITIAVVSPAAAQDAGELTLDWFIMDSGGDTSTGGDFSLVSSIGRPDAGTMSGGDCTISGGSWGVWSMMTVDEPSVPLSLGAAWADGAIVVSWPEHGSAGFVLEETAALSALSGNSTWSPVEAAAQTSDGKTSVRLSPAAGARFYRLRKP